VGRLKNSLDHVVLDHVVLDDGLDHVVLDHVVLAGGSIPDPAQRFLTAWSDM
jgi:hypothetical protein